MKHLTSIVTLVILSSVVVAQDDFLTLEDYTKYESVSNPKVSPDGKQIIYTRNWINLVEDKRESDMWIMNSDGSQNRFFLKGSNGTWSPDGKRIAFTKEGEPSGTQIFVKYLGVEGEPTQITRLDESPSNISWSPDGKHLAFGMFVEENKSWKVKLPDKPEGATWTKAPRFVDEVNYRRDRRGYIDPGYTHIFVVPSEGGTERQITSGNWNQGNSFDWASNNEIIFNSLRIEEAEYAYRESQLYSVNIGSGEIKQLTDRKGSEYSPAVSPDGSKVAFIGTEWTENFYHAMNLYVMNADGSNIRLLTKGLDRRLNSLEWAPDNSGVYFNVDDKGTRNLHFASTNGKWKKVTEGNHMMSVSDISSSGVVVGVRTSPTSPSDVVRIDTKSGSLTQLTHVNDDILDYRKLGEVDEVWYKSPDGTDIQGWLVKPPNFDASKQYPLILRIHGGPHAMYNTSFNFTFQLHAVEGYLVLYTNPRGSTGYGYDFANAIQNAYPGKDFEDLMSGVDEIVKRGIVDTNKMYVYGGSGGGVLTSWIIGHTDRFAAASVNYPVIDWLSFVGTTDGIGWYKNFKKYPWEDPTEHLERSPLMYVGNVTTPTMLMTGVKDLRTPISQTEEFYQALKVRKVPATMIRFNEEYHGTGSKPSNFMRTVAYLHHWFGEWDRKKSDESMDTTINLEKNN